MKNKKNIICIVLIVFLLAVAVIIWKGPGSRGSGTPSNPADSTVPGSNIEPGGNTEPGGNSGEGGSGEGGGSGQSGEPGKESETGEDNPGGDGGASIIEDGGDLIIIIPDDQDSGGL